MNKTLNFWLDIGMGTTLKSLTEIQNQSMTLGNMNRVVNALLAIYTVGLCTNALQISSKSFYYILFISLIGWSDMNKE
jgi:energy-converting hydrogenase Eha subunit H